LNGKKVPQLFVASGGAKFQLPEANPWTMGFQPSYEAEGRIYGTFLRDNYPNAVVAVLYQNDDFGKDVLRGLKQGLRDRASSIAAEEAYEVAEPTLDSRVVKLKASGASVFVNITSAKFAAQTIKKVGELGWKPTQIVTSVGASVGAVLQPAGLDNAQGLISAAFLKDFSDHQFENTPETNRFLEFLSKHAPFADKNDTMVAFSYAASQTIVQVLKQCGNDLTRENIIRQAANLKDFPTDTTLPGTLINTSPQDYSPIKQLQLVRFSGDHWQRIGPLLSNPAAR
jgi:branched-chain amino acid transport system substrate-binding protein